MSRPQSSPPSEESVHPQLSKVRKTMSRTANPQHVFDLIESIPLPLVVISAAEGTVVDANPAVEEVFGYKRRRLVGREAACLFPRLDDRKRLKKAAASGVVRGLEVQSRYRHGATMWIRVWQQRAICQGKECLLTLLLDVTAEKAEALAHQKERVALRELLKFSDQERELIACELHDGVIQDMTGAVMHLEAARRALEKGKPLSPAQLQEVQQLLRAGIREGRRLIDGVRAPDLEQGLVPALQQLVARLADQKGIAIRFRHRLPSKRLSPGAENAIYRMVQECLNNVWRHSRSERAEVELVQTERAIRLTVRDWGVGFDPDQIDRKRFGLTSLRQRARLLDGMVLIQSTPGYGCTVRITLPLNKTI